MSQPSVTLQFTHGILQTAERLGIALPLALREKVPHSGRTPLAVQDELWEAVCSAANDPLIGLRLGLSLHVGHLDMVGMLLMSCETQGEALDLLVEYHPIVGEGGDFHLAHEGDHCLLVYEPHYQVRRRERVEAVIACVLNLARWVTGDAFDANALQLTTAPGSDASTYRELLRTPVEFEAPRNALVFAPALQATPLIQANANLRDHLKRMADNALAQLAGSGLSAQVQALIRQEPRWGKERIAEQLGMSGRHLVRKLQEEGVTFRILRGTLLQQLAEQELRADESVAVVAEHLGYSDESAFIKAFKRWAGVTPSQFKTEARQALTLTPPPSPLPQAGGGT